MRTVNPSLKEDTGWLKTAGASGAAHSAATGGAAGFFPAKPPTGSSAKPKDATQHESKPATSGGSGSGSGPQKSTETDPTTTDKKPGLFGLSTTTIVIIVVVVVVIAAAVFFFRKGGK